MHHLLGRHQEAREGKASSTSPKGAKKMPPKKDSAMQYELQDYDTARLQTALLVQLFKNRLGQQDCQDCRNKGFVLDGFPKTKEDFSGLLVAPRTLY